MIRRVAITGIGVISPLGNSYEQVKGALRESRSGISMSADPSLELFPTRHAGYATDFEPDPRIPFKSRLGQFAVQSSFAALKDARIKEGEYEAEMKSLIIGSEPASIDVASEIHTLNQIYNGDNACIESPLDSGLYPESFLSYISHHSNLGGRSYFHLGTCSAASQAIGEGGRLIQRGLAKMVLCGGASSRVDPLSMIRLIRVGALAPTSGDDPTKISMPFDIKRQGFTMGEGAVMFVLEELDEALARNRTPYAVLKGYGAALDGCSITDPHPEELGMKLAMKRAIADASLVPEEVSYVNAHGTSTQKNDFHETRAIKDVFGTHAHDVPISSTKSSHGHLMSAAGAMELIPAICAVREGFIPPTLNLENSDPDCDLNYTPNFSQEWSVQYAMSNSFGLGGQNSSLVLERFDV